MNNNNFEEILHKSQEDKLNHIYNSFIKSYTPQEGEEKDYKDGKYKFINGHWKKINNQPQKQKSNISEDNLNQGKIPYNKIKEKEFYLYKYPSGKIGPVLIERKDLINNIQRIEINSFIGNGKASLPFTEKEEFMNFNIPYGMNKEQFINKIREGEQIKNKIYTIEEHKIKSPISSTKAWELNEEFVMGRNKKPYSEEIINEINKKYNKLVFEGNDKEYDKYVKEGEERFNFLNKKELNLLINFIKNRAYRDKINLKNITLSQLKSWILSHRTHYYNTSIPPLYDKIKENLK